MEIMKVFSDMYDEERIYSVLMGEEELRVFAKVKKKIEDEDEDEGLKIGDKIGIWTAKHLQTKKDRDAVIEAYDGPDGKGHKLAKQSAKWAAGLSAVPGAVIGGSIGYLKGGNKGAAVGAATGAASYGAMSGAGAYVGTRAGHALNKILRKHSRDIDDRSQRIADRNKVADGRMTKKEYVKKHNK